MSKRLKKVEQEIDSIDQVNLTNKNSRGIIIKG